MTEVEFHTGVEDRIAFACRLLRKAYRRGSRVLVTAPAEVLAELDRSLWTFDERDFVPHVRVPGSAQAVRERTPIWLAADATAGGLAGAPRLVINLGAPDTTVGSSTFGVITSVGSPPRVLQFGLKLAF